MRFDEAQTGIHFRFLAKKTSMNFVRPCRIYSKFFGSKNLSLTQRKDWPLHRPGDMRDHLNSTLTPRPQPQWQGVNVEGG